MYGLPMASSQVVGAEAVGTALSIRRKNVGLKGPFSPLPSMTNNLKLD